MNRFQKWWNKDKIKEEKIFARLDAIQEDFDKVNNKLEKTIAELEETTVELEDTKSELEIYRKKEEADNALRNGTEPWVVIKSDRLDPVKGIQIELDWNEAFIQYLKDNGLTGKDEDTIVQKWLALLYHNLLDRFEQQGIENSDVITPSEFE